MTADHSWVSIRSLSRDSVAWSRLRLVQPTRPEVSNSTRFLQHQPVLDGVRGLAWFAVFLGHAGLAPGLAVGQVAMFVFFGLSGFLITTVLSVERIRTGRIRLRRFYARRALRLVPALLTFVVVWLLVVAIFGHESWIATVPGSSGGSNGLSFSVAAEGAAGALTYLTNWCGLFNIFSGYVPLGHLWSLAVEEQFYLLWAPLLVVLIAVRRRVAALAAFLLAAASFVDVVVLQHAHSTTPWVFYSTDTRSGAFLVGGGVGLLWSERRTLATWWHQVCTPVAGVGLAVLAWCGWVFAHQVSASTYASAWILVSVFAPVSVVALVDRRGAGASWLANPLLTYLGRRSYALYLWHYVWLTWLHGLGFTGVVLALAATLGCAEISWRLVESPCLRLKSRLVPGNQPPGSAIRPSGLDEASVRSDVPELAGSSA
jgi:peptidoglycan/LPS O-acetylase OafA/YrhL